MEKNKIQILPETLAKQIAAGEVVERPASVVKELVENAVDAEATSITVEVFEGGRKEIRVIDNGTGMTRGDAVLSLERHSTSKIKTIEELFNIRTLGFRGEALPSIASVSKMRIKTLYQDENSGTELYAEGGEIRVVKDTGCPRGTTIEVKNLFYNTPARLKFLKSINTELGYISHIVSQEALAFPKIHFRLFHDKRLLINAPPLDNDLERIALLFGKKLLKEMIAVEAIYNDIELHGYISPPSLTKSSRNYQHLFVNSRPVKDKTVTHAVYQAYRTFMPRDKNPVFFLFLKVKPDTVDVNVHPSKMEVKFRNQSEIHEFIEEFVRSHIMAGHRVENKTETADETEKGNDFSFLTPGETLRPEQQRISDIITTYVSSSQKKISEPPLFNYSDGKIVQKLHKPKSVEIFQFIGQINKSFLLFQEKEGILFVDQHVAHERILFEKLLRDFKASHIQVQSLLFPLFLELSKREALLLEEYADGFRRLGFDIEGLRGMSFMIRGIPSVFSQESGERALADILARLVETERMKSFEEMIEEILITMACHGALKDNQTLSEREAVKLMDDLMKTEIPHTCPHGRPIMLLLNTDDLRKRFQTK
jgi:DNA mismatch repair protein MutL